LRIRKFVIEDNVYLCSETLLTPFSGKEKIILKRMHSIFTLLLVEDSLEVGLPVLSMHNSSGKSAATVEFRLGLASRCFHRKYTSFWP